MHSLFHAYEARQRRREAGPAAIRNATYYLGKLDSWMTEQAFQPLAADGSKDASSQLLGAATRSGQIPRIGWRANRCRRSHGGRGETRVPNIIVGRFDL